jgi:hypothetical protein
MQRSAAGPQLPETQAWQKGTAAPVVVPPVVVPPVLPPLVLPLVVPPEVVVPPLEVPAPPPVLGPT